MVAGAIKALEPWINDDRLKRVSGVLKKRTKHSKFLFENPSNPSNVWACLRTIDSFGMQNVDVIIDSGRYAGKQAISQKKGMRTAMGSAQWLTLTNHQTTTTKEDERGRRIVFSVFFSHSDTVDMTYANIPLLGICMLTCLILHCGQPGHGFEFPGDSTTVDELSNPFLKVVPLTSESLSAFRR